MLWMYSGFLDPKPQDQIISGNSITSLGWDPDVIMSVLRIIPRVTLPNPRVTSLWSMLFFCLNQTPLMYLSYSGFQNNLLPSKPNIRGTASTPRRSSAPMKSVDPSARRAASHETLNSPKSSTSPTKPGPRHSTSSTPTGPSKKWSTTSNNMENGHLTPARWLIPECSVCLLPWFHFAWTEFQSFSVPFYPAHLPLSRSTMFLFHVFDHCRFLLYSLNGLLDV